MGVKPRAAGQYFLRQSLGERRGDSSGRSAPPPKQRAGRDHSWPSMPSGMDGPLLVKRIHTYPIDQGPDVEVLVLIWYPGELRQWIDHGGHRTCDVSWRRAPTEPESTRSPPKGCGSLHPLSSPDVLEVTRIAPGPAPSPQVTAGSIQDIHDGLPPETQGEVG